MIQLLLLFNSTNIIKTLFLFFFKEQVILTVNTQFCFLNFAVQG